ncbi:MAG: hypothetical protein QOE84_2621, partial [Actinomycetota bacterium]|nr:hypothetical protein [Actinomycetota bacterium]
AVLESPSAAAPPAPAAAPAPALSGPSDLPAGVSPVARRDPAPLPKPAAWPFPEAFPATSGTGRLTGGAFEWTDFIYDDHGAHGLASTGYTGQGTASQGTYAYPAGPARQNGADIFRVGVGMDRDASYWRVDWTTLVDANVPIAVFALDTDDKASTGTPTWPIGAGITSPGIDRGLVVSSRGAWLTDAAGALVPVGRPVVDLTSNSFVLRLDRSVLPVAGTWKVRIASGVAGADGRSFAPVPGGSLPGQPPVYNVSFRANGQEPLAGNAWMDDAQAAAIGNGDVSAFSARVSWADLSNGRATAEPEPAGASVRWYPSSLPVGEGVVPDDTAESPVQDYRPNLLSRPQPYAVYVPKTYRPSRPAKLTWLLHSLGSVYTQYQAGPTSDLQQFCEDRYSICVSPEGRAPDMYWYDEAEYDLWQVWNRIARQYSLDPASTVVTGFSMGGCGSWSWPLGYPDVFAESAPMAGITANKAYRFAIPSALYPGSPEVTGIDFSERYTAIGDQDPLVENARWMRYFIAQGLLDELVPVTQNIQMADKFKAFGQRYRLQLHPAEGHTEWASKGMYGAIADNLSNGRLADRPGHVTYVWHPDRFHPEWGMPATGSFWVKDPIARDKRPVALARVDATSAANPDPAVTPEFSAGPMASTDPSPALVQEQVWKLGARPAPAPTMHVDLRNVASVRLDLAGAGFARGERRTAITVKTDGPTTVALSGLPAGARVLRDGAGAGVVSAAGITAVRVTAGTHVLRLAGGGAVGRAAGSDAASAPMSPEITQLPRTGPPAGVAGVGAAVLVAALVLCRCRGYTVQR